nr:wiskott-Aldrich syndrome protein homolog 1 [Taeniopygia guttata]
MAAPLPAGALPPPPAPSLPRAADTGSPDRRRQHRARPGLPGQGAGRGAGCGRVLPAFSCSPPPSYADIERNDRGGRRPAATSASRGRIQDPATAPRRWRLPRATGTLPLGRAAGGFAPSRPPLRAQRRPPRLPARSFFLLPLRREEGIGSTPAVPSSPSLPRGREGRGGGLAPRLGPWPGAGSASLPASKGRLCPGIQGGASPPSPLSPGAERRCRPRLPPPGAAPSAAAPPRNSAGALSNNKGLEAGRQAGRDGRPADASSGILGAVVGTRLLNGRLWNGIAALLSSSSDVSLQRNSPPSVPWLKGAR